jgi:hypothetical protein
MSAIPWLNIASSSGDVLSAAVSDWARRLSPVMSSSTACSRVALAVANYDGVLVVLRSVRRAWRSSATCTLAW